MKTWQYVKTYNKEAFHN